MSFVSHSQAWAGILRNSGITYSRPPQHTSLRSLEISIQLSMCNCDINLHHRVKYPRSITITSSCYSKWLPFLSWTKGQRNVHLAFLCLTVIVSRVFLLKTQLLWRISLHFPIWYLSMCCPATSLNLLLTSAPGLLSPSLSLTSIFTFGNFKNSINYLLKKKKSPGQVLWPDSLYYHIPLQPSTPMCTFSTMYLPMTALPLST